MSLESATYISELTSSNPAATDQKSQGDDHLRLIKQVLQGTFPNASRAFRIPAATANTAGDVTIHASTDDNKIIPVNARSANRTVTLPVTPTFDGYSFQLVKADFSINTVTVNGNGNNINGLTSLVLSQPYETLRLVWSAADTAWYGILNYRAPVGSLIATALTAAPEGYVLAGTGSIGSASSAGTLRAHADALALFQTFWNNFSDTICPVTTGRGASALADFDANKRLTVFDMRGRAVFGKDNMGGTAADRITNALSGVVGTTLGASGGAQSVTILQANFPNITFPDTLSLAGSQAGNLVRNLGIVTDTYDSVPSVNAVRTLTFNNTTLSITGSVTSGGSGTALNKLSPAAIMNLCWKL